MSRRKPLVCQHLEHLSRSALERHQQIIREYVRGRHGVYALYRRDHLYYVGLASNLRNRLKQHLKDRHGTSWDRFSVYLTIGDSHLKELESLVLRIVKPKGNRHSGKFAKSDSLRSRLASDLRRHYRSEVDEMLGRRSAVRDDDAIASSGDSELARLLKGRRLRLRADYRDERFRAIVRRDGQVRFDGRVFKTPSGAAKAIRKRATNGWSFWLCERAPGDWVRLSALRRKKATRR